MIPLPNILWLYSISTLTDFLRSTSLIRVKLTCWRKYGRLPKPRNSIVHTRWRPSECREGTRRHLPSYDRDRRYESLGREHHGWNGTLGKAIKLNWSVLLPSVYRDSAIVDLASFQYVGDRFDAKERAIEWSEILQIHLTRFDDNLLAKNEIYTPCSYSICNISLGDGPSWMISRGSFWCWCRWVCSRGSGDSKGNFQSWIDCSANLR